MRGPPAAPHSQEKTMIDALPRTRGAVAAALALIGLHGAASAQGNDPFLGQIMCAGFNFAPQGWAELNGQLLPIAQNTALFSLLGTQYGGNGQTTFALPDMRGRVLVHAGQGPGLTPREQGEAAGSEQVTLNSAQLPAHVHTVTPQGSVADASLISPIGGVPATKSRTTLYAPGPGTVPMGPVVTSAAGSSQPVPVMPPYVAVKCFMAMTGIFPSRP
jgi:microcystin-dependent protein